MDHIFVNNIRLFAPDSRKGLIDEAFKQRKILVAVNAEKILMADRGFADFISSNIGYPDGIGAVWLLQKRGFKSVRKIPGVELWLEIISQRYKGNSFYLVGGKEEVIQQTVQKLKRDYPGIILLGYRNGYVTDEEKVSLFQDID